MVLPNNEILRAVLRSKSGPRLLFHADDHKMEFFPHEIEHIGDFIKDTGAEGRRLIIAIEFRKDIDVKNFMSKTDAHIDQYFRRELGIEPGFVSKLKWLRNNIESDTKIIPIDMIKPGIAAFVGVADTIRKAELGNDEYKGTGFTLAMATLLGCCDNARDNYMIKNLESIRTNAKNQNILVITGAMHVESLRRGLNINSEFDTTNPNMARMHDLTGGLFKIIYNRAAEMFPDSVNELERVIGVNTNRLRLDREQFAMPYLKLVSKLSKPESCRELSKDLCDLIIFRHLVSLSFDLEKDIGREQIAGVVVNLVNQLRDVPVKISGDIKFWVSDDELIDYMKKSAAGIKVEFPKSLGNAYDLETKAMIAPRLRHAA